MFYAESWHSLCIQCCTLHCIATLLLNDNFSRVEYFKQITVFAMHMHNRPPRAHTILIEFTLHAIWCVCARALDLKCINRFFELIHGIYRPNAGHVTHKEMIWFFFSHGKSTHYYQLDCQVALSKTLVEQDRRIVHAFWDSESENTYVNCLFLLVQQSPIRLYSI